MSQPWLSATLTDMLLLASWDWVAPISPQPVPCSEWGDLGDQPSPKAPGTPFGSSPLLRISPRSICPPLGSRGSPLDAIAHEARARWKLVLGVRGGGQTPVCTVAKVGLSIHFTKKAFLSPRTMVSVLFESNGSLQIKHVKKAHYWGEAKGRLSWGLESPSQRTPSPLETLGLCKLQTKTRFPNPLFKQEPVEELSQP